MSQRSGRTQGARGDIVIIMSYAAMTPEEARTWKPKVVFPDTDTNRLIN